MNFKIGINEFVDIRYQDVRKNGEIHKIHKDTQKV